MEMKIKIEELNMMKEMNSSSSRSVLTQPQCIPYPQHPAMIPADPVQCQDPRPPSPTPGPRHQQPVNDLTNLRISSPVAPDDEEDDLMTQFWVCHLQQMSDPSSEFYKIASAKGIPNGILRELHKDLHEFKEIWRAGTALGDLGRR